MAKKTKWSYRKKGKRMDWLPCTQKDKDKLEKMRPHKFEFKENKVPEPTPNQVVKEDNE